jgi:hypothetical protein
MCEVRVDAKVKYALYYAKNAAQAVLFDWHDANQGIAHAQYVHVTDALSALGIDPCIYQPRPYGGNY